VDAAALVVTVIVKEKNRLIQNVPEMTAVNVIMIVIGTGVVLEIVTATIAIETGIEITEKEIEVVIEIMSVEIEEIEEEIENVIVTEDIVGIVTKMAAIMINVITVVVVVTVIVIVDAEIIENEGMIFKVDEVEECVVEAVVEDLIEVEEIQVGEWGGLVAVVITCIEVEMILIEIEVALMDFVGVDVDEVDQDKFHGAEFPHEEEEDQDFHHMDNTHHHMLLVNTLHHRQVLLDISPLHLAICNPIPQIPFHHKCPLA